MNRDTDEIKRLISDLNSKKAIIITGAGVTSASEGMVYVDLMGLFVFGNLNKSGKYGQYARQCFEEINRQDLMKQHRVDEMPRLRKKREKIILPEPKKKASRKKRGE